QFIEGLLAAPGRLFAQPVLRGEIVFDLHARLLAQTANRLDEGDALCFLDEAEDVTRRLAAETMVPAALLVHVEARGLFFVERAEPEQAASATLQLHRFPDDRRDADPLADALDGVLGDHAGRPDLTAKRARSIRPAARAGRGAVLGSAVPARRAVLAAKAGAGKAVRADLPTLKARSEAFRWQARARMVQAAARDNFSGEESSRWCKR